MPQKQSAMKEYITNAMISLRDKGYMTLDLIKLGIYTAEEIQEMQEICMSEYYKYFTDRGLKLADIKNYQNRSSGNFNIKLIGLISADIKNYLNHLSKNLYARHAYKIKKYLKALCHSLINLFITSTFMNHYLNLDKLSEDTI